MHLNFVALAAMLAAGGCGGGTGSDEQVTRSRTVSGPGFTFSAPADRELARTPRSVTVLPVDEASQELQSVTRFPLIKPYRPSLWQAAAAELDGVAERLAASLGGEYGAEPQTVRRGGLRGRLYLIRYERDGAELSQRLTLLLSRRTEYQLLCRWEGSGAAPAACTQLETSFRLR